MDSKPVTSVIVAVYNGAKTLQRCIDSVSNQTYPQKELIIIDGGSADGTVDILRVNNDKIAYWKFKPDRGIYHAWNKALDHVQGAWIYFWGQRLLLETRCAGAYKGAFNQSRIYWNEVSIRAGGKSNGAR